MDMRHKGSTGAVLVVMALTGLSACGASSSSANGAASQKAAAAAPAPGKVAVHASAGSGGASAGGAGSAAGGSGLGTSVAPAQALVIQTGTIDLEVSGAKLAHVFSLVTAVATREGGFVASSTMRSGRHPSASVTLRVPDDEAVGAVSSIDGLGKVTSRSFGGRDVTGQVVNLASEIANLTSEEQATRALLAKAGSVRNILAIQGDLFGLQGQIEELTAQHNSLDNRVQYATVTVLLSTGPTPAPGTPRRPTTVSRFWHLATGHSVDAVRGIVLAIGWAAPILIAAAALGAGWLVVRRRRRDHGPVTAEST